MPSSFQIDVFHGQLSAHAAQVYARVDGLPGGQEWTITGRIRGPECRHAKTLPTNHSFVDLGMGETLLARATLPDPCSWSPDLPALYRVTLELRHGDDVVQTAERELGLRVFGTRGNSFYLDGKRWVLRAVHPECVEATPLTDWREAVAAMLVDHPSDELCREASREGVLLVARVKGDDIGVLHRLSHWASVGIVVSSGPSYILTEARRQFPNLLMAGIAESDEGGDRPDAYSAMFIAETALNSQGSRFVPPSQPTIPVRRLDGLRPLADARFSCDLLQRDLAYLGDFAGYVVDLQGAPPT